MDINTIIDYIMQTPENVNPAVLSDMLDELEPSGSSSQKLLWCTATKINSNTWQMDKTYKDITSAIEQQLLPVLVYITTDGSNITQREIVVYSNNYLYNQQYNVIFYPTYATFSASSDTELLTQAIT